MSKAPIALVHGWGGSFQGTWGDTGWREVFADREIIPIDLPGHGTGAQSHDPADYADLASGLDAMLPALPDGELDILGFSLGAKLSLELACRRPARFRRIGAAGLGNGAFYETGAGLSDVLDRGFPPEDRARMPVIAAYVDESPNDWKAIAAVLRRPTNPVATPERMSTIASQVAIINGDRDTVAIPDETLRAAIPTHKYYPLPGVDHFTLHHQQSFKDAARDWFGG